MISSNTWQKFLYIEEVHNEAKSFEMRLWHRFQKIHRLHGKSNGD